LSPGNYTPEQEAMLRKAAKTAKSDTVFVYLPGVCVWCKKTFDIAKAKSEGGSEWACSERCADLTINEVLAG